MAENNDAEVVLAHLPHILFLGRQGDGLPQYPGLPHNWFPIRLSIQSWFVDKERNIEIPRRGFLVVPNCSSTVHAATGRTLARPIVDLGCFQDVPTAEAQMKGYIALSRVRDAHILPIAQSFSPKLFAQGPQPFPALLLQVLRNEVDGPGIPSACLKIEEELTARRSAASPLKLKNMKWMCCLCSKDQTWNAFISNSDDSA